MAPTAPSTVPSLYDLGLQLRTADDHTVGLDVARGHVVLVSMFYGTCPAACPVLVEEIERLLAASSDANARVVLVSFDAARDTPARLRELAREHHLDDRFTLASASDGDARVLAAALGIKYRHLPDGSFSHNIAVVALDADGRPLARMDRLGDDAALEAVLR